MRTTGLLVLVIAGLLLATTAAAQTGVPGETPVESMPPPEETPPAETPPPDDPGDPPDMVVATSTIPGKAIGIGTGWVLPADVTIPNAASVRFRLASGLTVEALLEVSWEGTTVDNEPDIGPGTTDGSGTLVGQVSALVRKPLATRGRFQFVGVAGAGLGYTSNTDDPDGDDNSTTDTTMSAFAIWGFGIDWFFRSGWSFSLTAANPLLSFVQFHDDGLFNDQTITSFQIGAIYDPTIQAMFHLYY
jgi:hypothetical protein